jgi:hypothetical protein
VKEKLRKAITNNNDLYRAIFEQYQIKSEKNGFVWYCLEETPPLYSNLVTISENWQPDEIFRQIDFNFEKENWSEWSIKDSFAVLDLTEFGFSKLFDANWIYLESDSFVPIIQTEKLHYEIIEDEQTLSKWKLAWDTDEKLGDKIFNPKLLSKNDVFFIAGFEKGNLVNGCLVNKTEDVFGISNFFAPNENINYWSQIISFIFDSKGQLDIVGYERNDLSKQLNNIGFEEIGNLKVWLKSN